MDDKELVALLERQLTAAQDAGPDEDEQRKALDYYYGRPRGDEVPGRSQVQSLDVADMTHAILAQVLPSFTQDRVCSFEPDGQGDEDLARLESEAVNRVLMEDNRGYLVLYEALKDALLLKNGIIKVYLRDDDGGRRVAVEAVDPLNFRVGEETNCVNLDQYRTGFVAEAKVYTRGDLVAMGLPAEKVANIPPLNSDSTESIAQQARYTGGYRQNSVDTPEATESVRVWECYIRLPGGKSDRLSLTRCLLGGQEILLQEKVDYLPYATGSAFPLPHRFWGLSVYDRLASVQSAKTAIKRQWLDNLANCNNSREAINDNVDRKSVADSRPGGKVVVKGVGPVQEAISPLPVIDVGPAALSFLAYEDQVRADRGGASLQMATAESQLTQGAIGSQGVDRIFSVQEQLAGMLARNLAETLVRSTFLLVHRVLREEYGEPLTLRLADQWVEVDPSGWRERTRVNVKSGLTPGERSRKAAAMTTVVQLQTQALQMGLAGALVAAPQLYSALLDWGAANELDSIQSYFIDPRSQQAQQAAAASAQQQQQAEALQMQMAQAQMQLEGQKLQLERFKIDTENQLKTWTEILHAEIEEAKLVGAATAELQRVELEGRLAAARPGDGSSGGGAGGGA